MTTTIVFENNTDEPLSQLSCTLINELFKSLPETRLYEMTPHSIKPCLGCFNCWIKTPGLCTFKDLSLSINKSIVHSQFAVWVIPIHYGCYSSTIKNVLDRSLPLVLPFFKKKQGEVHHLLRYKTSAKRIIIAYNKNFTTEEKESFLQLTKANDINFGLSETEVFFCTNLNEIEHTLLKTKNRLNEL